MNLENLLQDLDAQLVINATEGAAGTTDINGDAVDADGADLLLAVITFGAITAGAVTSVKWQEDDNAAMSSASDLLSTAITVADDDDDKIVLMSLIRPQNRWNRIVVDRATQNAVVASAVVFRIGLHEVPKLTKHADVIGFEQHVFPAAGTA